MTPKKVDNDLRKLAQKLREMTPKKKMSKIRFKMNDFLSDDYIEGYNQALKDLKNKAMEDEKFTYRTTRNIMDLIEGLLKK